MADRESASIQMKKRSKLPVFPNRLREIRVAAGLSAAELARQARVAGRTLYNVEKGLVRSRDDIFYRIINALNAVIHPPVPYTIRDVFPLVK